MRNGTVKSFNASGGFGVITPDGGGRDVHVAAASVRTAGLADLAAGQRLSFDVLPSDDMRVTAVALRLI